MIELLKSWWEHLQNEPPNKFFWYELTEDMQAQDWRSPWGILRSANLAHDFGSDYVGWTTSEIYELFCDEERYIAHLENAGRVD